MFKCYYKYLGFLLIRRAKRRFELCHAGSLMSSCRKRSKWVKKRRKKKLPKDFFLLFLIALSCKAQNPF